MNRRANDKAIKYFQSRRAYYNHFIYSASLDYADNSVLNIDFTSVKALLKALKLKVENTMQKTMSKSKSDKATKRQVKVIESVKSKSAKRAYVLIDYADDKSNVIMSTSFNKLIKKVKASDFFNMILFKVNSRQQSKKNYNSMLASVHANKKRSQIKDAILASTYDKNTHFDSYRTRALNFIKANISDAQLDKQSKKLSTFFATDKASANKIVNV